MSKLILDVVLPITTVSEANSSQHWSKKAKRHKIQQYLISSAMNSILEDRLIPCEVSMVRIASRKLDSDNLVSSFKWIRDEIADYLTPGKKKGISDSSASIVWRYGQIKGSPIAVRIVIRLLNEFEILDSGIETLLAGFAPLPAKLK